jgi:ankyrin repeat protein
VTTKKLAKISTPVIEAVLAADGGRIRAAVAAGGRIDERDSDGRTPLHHASIQNQEEIVDILLGLGAPVAPIDHDGWSPLHFAARNYAIGIARKLLQAGAPVDSSDSHGNTPLFRAVFESKGRGEMITLLLRAGADRDRENSHGTTPAKLAATISNYDVKRWLQP